MKRKRIPENKRTSIIVDDLTECFVCGHPYPELHEVFFGINREKAKQYKMVLPLCYEHHRGKFSPHMDREIDLAYKSLAQRKCEEHYGMSREEFINTFGRSYIDEDTEGINP